MGSVVWDAPGLTPPPVPKTALLVWVSTASKALTGCELPGGCSFGVGWSPGIVSLKPGKVQNVLQHGSGKPGGPSSSPVVWERWGAGGTECSGGRCSQVCRTQSLPDLALGFAVVGRPGGPEFQSHKIPANSISALGKNPLPSRTRGL